MFSADDIAQRLLYYNAVFLGIQSLVGSEFRGVCPWGLLIGSFSGVLQWGLLVGSAIAGPLFYIKKTEEMTSLPDFPIMMFLHYTS